MLTEEQQIAELISNFAAGLQPPPDETVSEWADKNRILPQTSSAEPGTWRTDRTPYLREIMDALSANSRVREVAWMKSAQIGGTEAGINWISYIMDRNPGPSMIVQPTILLAERFSKQRLAPQFDLMPGLNEKVSGAAGSNNLLEKSFPGGILLLTGANSASGLRSMPIKNLFLDEVDAYPEDADGEGSPVDLAVARTTTFSRKKIFYNSTPVFEASSVIYRKFLEGDQRFYNIPCPHCGTHQKLEFSRLKWDQKPNGSIRSVWYECAHCLEPIEERFKPQLLKEGFWNPENPGAEMRSYQISALYSPLGWYSWREMASDFLKAKGNPEKMRVFVNTRLGEPWVEEGTRLESHELTARVEKYSAEVPAGAVILTAAVDIQTAAGGRLEIEVVGWGPGFESWLIDYKTIHGRHDDPKTWQSLDDYLLQGWTHETGNRILINGVFVDSGDGETTLDCYKYTKPRESRRVFSSKGRGGPLAIIHTATKSNRAGATLYTIGVDAAKSAVFSNLRISEPGPGFCHFPDGTTESYFLGLTSEKQIKVVKNGRLTLTWKKIRERNEPLDLRVLNFAMIQLLAPNFEAISKRLANSVVSVDTKPENRVSRRTGPIVFSKGIR
jgi:phage terminase large subunit GpA-like protein